MTFNWCFIGTGKIANKVAKEVVSAAGHKIVSVYNRTYEKAETFAKTYHSIAYKNALDAIKDPRVEGVYIATTNETHYAYIKLCLENHKPVLCEKPITGNAKQFAELIALAKKTKTFLSEAMWTWYNPVAHKVKKWIEEGRIGDIKKVDCRFNVPMLNYLKKNSRLSSVEKYGGALLDIGIYPVRYIYELFGWPDQIISKGKVRHGVDISNKSIFVYEDFKAVVSSRMDLYTGEYCLIKGEYGKIKVPFFHMANKAILYTDNEKIVFNDPAKKFARQFMKVAADIKDGQRESIVNLDSSLEVMKILDEIRSQIGVLYECDK